MKISNQKFYSLKIGDLIYTGTPEGVGRVIAGDKLKGFITDKEMLRTFNCGVGFCIIIDPKNLDKVKKFFSSEYKPYVIGKIISGKNKIKLNEKINWY